jgi:hypothetical protein
MITEYDKRRQLQKEKDELHKENKELKETMKSAYIKGGIDGLTMVHKENKTQVYEQKLSIEMDTEKQEVTFKNLTYKFNDILNISHFIKESLLDKESK